MRWTLIIAVMFLLSVPALGQTTKPAPPAWDHTVAGLTTATSRDALLPLLASDCTIRRFGGERDTSNEPLLEFIASHIVLGAHAYVYPPAMMAMDIAADVNASPLVSDEIKKAMTLEGPEAQKNAAAVAARWVKQCLGTDDGTPVGVIVLWSSSGDRSLQRRATFILVRGDAVGDEFRISAIMYGDPLQ